MYQSLHSQGFEALKHRPECQNTLPATDPGTMGQEPISANDYCCTLRPMMDLIRDSSRVASFVQSPKNWLYYCAIKWYLPFHITKKNYQDDLFLLINEKVRMRQMHWTASYNWIKTNHGLIMTTTRRQANVKCEMKNLRPPNEALAGSILILD